MSRFNLSAWAVAHRSLTGFLIALLFIAGGFSYQKLGRGEDPSFTLKLMVVTAVWPGATARETQALVAERIERKLQDTPYIDHLDTYTRPGFVASMLSFRDDTPPAQVPALFYQVRKRLDDLRPDLPQGVQGPFANDEFTDVYGAVFALTGADNATLVRAAEGIRNRLLKVAGAEKVNILGEIPRTVFVEFNQARLASLGVTVQEIAAALARQNLVAASGIVDTASSRVPVRVSGALAAGTDGGVAAVGDVPVASGGRTLRLGEVASIRAGYQEPLFSEVRHNAQGAVVIAVSMRKGTNALHFGAALTEEMARIQADLPVGLALDRIADQPEVVAEAVGEFLMKFVAALVVVLLVSFASLGFRAGLVVALAVPLTLAIVFIVMEAAGIELQRISLGALILSLGLLVDDAIIAIETMVVKLDEGWDRVRAAGHAWTSTAFPMLSGTLVTAAGFMPVGLANSTTGEYAGGIFWVVGLALLASWVVAVVFTPFLGVLLLPAPKRGAGQAHHAIYETRIYRALRRAVQWSLRWRRSVVLATVALLVLAGAGMGLVKQQFFPSSARPELLLDVTLRQGASHAATAAAVAKIEAKLAGDPELKRDVRWFTAYIGNGGPRFALTVNPALPNDAVATMVLTTTDMEARERARARLMAFVAAEGVPEARVRVSRMELGPPVGFPVQFRVVGADMQAVRGVADEALAALRATPGTRRAEIGWGERAPGLTLELDQARIRALGLSPAQIAQTLQAQISGTTATQLRAGTKLIDVVLRAAPEERLELDRLADLVLMTPAGPLPLSQLGRIVATVEEPILWRRDRAAFITVRADIQDGLQAPDVTAAALPRIRAIALPPGVSIQTGGAAEESAKANASLAAVFPLMIATMVLLLMVQLQDLGRVALVLATAPLGLIGAVAALLAADAAFGFVALLGVIALAGMIMRNTVILVDQVRQDLAAGHSLAEAIVESTVRRARPVVLTALAAILAFVPLSLNVFWGPMAIAMIGGLAAATGLTLVFLPALYALCYRVKLPGRETADAVPDSAVQRAG
ncbi:MAG: efflux RND transporter permease subunit [Acetobacteraceae bacterium]|nr:efflux RND transporter permease subunit [Acetobacteraceae bacterium]